jgi:hypothetical protein
MVLKQSPCQQAIETHLMIRTIALRKYTNGGDAFGKRKKCPMDMRSRQRDIHQGLHHPQAKHLQEDEYPTNLDHCTLGSASMMERFTFP